MYAYAYAYGIFFLSTQKPNSQRGAGAAYGNGRAAAQRRALACARLAAAARRIQQHCSDQSRGLERSCGRRRRHELVGIRRAPLLAARQACLD